MINRIIELFEQLNFSCPDDQVRLQISNNALLCPDCGRVFPIYDENVIDLLPSCPKDLGTNSNRQYQSEYLEEYKKKLQLSSLENPWGAPEDVPSGWREKRYREVRYLETLLETTGDADILCDFSAGAGYYTLGFASRYKAILHCDISASSISYSYRHSKSFGIENIIFVRMDYSRPPFQNSLPRIICMDTLIRGISHEFMLLKSIQNSLSSGGVAFVDFHNWWHNPLRRLGLFPQNFGDNKSYSEIELDKLLKKAGIEKYKKYHFCQEVDQTNSIGRLSAMFIPPTRFVIQFPNENSSYS